jgi:hypothetical protein
MSTALDKLKSRLHGVRAISDRSYEAICPCEVHGNQPARLVFGAPDRLQRFVSFACQEGCSTTAVLSAIGMDESELLPPPIENRQPERRRVAKPAKGKGAQQVSTAKAERVGVLVVAHPDGYLEFYSEPHVNVRIVRVPATENRENEAAAIDVAEAMIPPSHRKLYRDDFMRINYLLRPLTIETALNERAMVDAIRDLNRLKVEGPPAWQVL